MLTSEEIETLTNGRYYTVPPGHAASIWQLPFSDVPANNDFSDSVFESAATD